MNSFAELLDNPSARSPVDVQNEAEQSFSDFVLKSSLHERRCGDPIPTGTYVAIGVATYSPAELALLDEMNARHDQWTGQGIQIAVFSVLHCKTDSDFARYLPGFGSNRKVHHTPFLAVWQDKHLSKTNTGLHATRKALKELGIL